MARFGLGLFFGLAVGYAYAEQLPGVEFTERARSNYMLQCQGCHGADGQGSRHGEVPDMRGVVGLFLRVEAGREYLVRVPGSAFSQLTDSALAEVLNWLLPKLSATEMPPYFQPFRAGEVGELRKKPLLDPVAERSRLLARLENIGIRVGVTAKTPHD